MTMVGSGTTRRRYLSSVEGARKKYLGSDGSSVILPSESSGVVWTDAELISSSLDSRKSANAARSPLKEMLDDEEKAAQDMDDKEDDEEDPRPDPEAEVEPAEKKDEDKDGGDDVSVVAVAVGYKENALQDEVKR
jgi:hypothetical protein